MSALVEFARHTAPEVLGGFAAYWLHIFKTRLFHGLVRAAARLLKGRYA